MCVLAVVYGLWELLNLRMSTSSSLTSGKAMSSGGSNSQSSQGPTSVSLRTTRSSGKNNQIVTWHPEVYDPWAVFGMKMPPNGIITDMDYFHRRCDNAVDYWMANGGFDMQTLAYARQACLFLSGLKQEKQQHQLKAGGNSVAYSEVQKVQKQLEDMQAALNNQSAQFKHHQHLQDTQHYQQQEELRQWGQGVRAALQRRIDELERSLEETEQAASCAPLWFKSFKEFEITKCSKAEHLRVGSADLHDAFVEFLSRHHRDVVAPPHKEFRELMEKMGYEYEQLYIGGTNKRGFKGIGLSRSLT